MAKYSVVSGNWEGYFEYGIEYQCAGERVRFQLKLEEFDYGQFRGECTELEGVGVNTEVATIEGFMEADFINFTKTYPSPNKDEFGNEIKGHYLIIYTGNYDWHTMSFSGAWEILSFNEVDINGNMLTTGDGKWKMSRI
ncbi:MAG TPA: hypothetical protein VMR70_04735 [Flavisolibacter sp.]|nr:hypothetical protein [Flavisolibacter sp.]